MSVSGQYLAVDLQRRSPVEGGTGSVVHLVGNGVEVVLAVHREVGALGQILAQHPVGVLARASLPGTVRVAEVHLHARALGEGLMSCHLAALVVGQRLAQGCRDGVELGAEGLEP